jgi:hypothetical protein
MRGLFSFKPLAQNPLRAVLNNRKTIRRPERGT